MNIYVSDYATGVITSPTAVTSTPSWSSNAYHAQIEVYPAGFQTPVVFARKSIMSAPIGSVNQANGRLHIRGVGDSSLGSNASSRIAVFETDDGTEHVGIDANGNLVLSNQTNGAASATATLGNAPAAGNPSFWLRAYLGTQRVAIPCWNY
jgi:hypothetical protein